MTRAATNADLNAELNRKLSGNEPTLCVSLIRNDVDLALAVEAAGADGLKVHVNLEHPYAGVRLGSFEEEVEKLDALVAAVSIPVGIVPRGVLGTSVDEVSTYAGHGFAFVDLYTSVFNAALLRVPGIGKWAAPKGDHSPEMLSELARVPGIDAIEVSFLAPAEYGAPFSLDDLMRLRVGLAAIAGRKPLVLPTDRRLTEADIPVLMENGVSNFLIGYAVTGSEPSDVVSATSRFVAAIAAAGA
ncbi:MAG TPA: hypothetical protein VFN03_00205 [Trueperaceae bacterium]|nr:hypothetical protein [Trueperaceae bacterium]